MEGGYTRQTNALVCQQTRVGEGRRGDKGLPPRLEMLGMVMVVWGAGDVWNRVLVA